MNNSFIHFLLTRFLRFTFLEEAVITYNYDHLKVNNFYFSFYY